MLVTDTDDGESQWRHLGVGDKGLGANCVVERQTPGRCAPMRGAGACSSALQAVPANDCGALAE